MNHFTKKESSPKQILPEYAGNPLIAGLPDLWTPAQVSAKLTGEVIYSAEERSCSPLYRMHAVSRLTSQYFQILPQHIDLEARISRSIRQGYVSRNPLLPEYTEMLVEGHDAIADRIGYRKRVWHTDAFGFSIVGMSGVGKTTAIQKILSLYPQYIAHQRYEEKPFFFTQIVWLKLDCPYDGSLKGLCVEFFRAVDQVIKTNYLEQYGTKRHTVDVMIAQMAQIVSLHAIGLLVIDEIQHLSLAKGGGSEKMLNYFVKLVNDLGLPIILIGTNKALPVLQSEFRQARRGSGQGDLIWERLPKNDLWRVFVTSMWRYQWTQKKTALTGAMYDCLYDESQGIIDIAVKLYAMVQIRAIATGAETFGAADIQTVAEERLRLVRPMLKALRSGDEGKISQYSDIAPISIEEYLASYTVGMEQVMSAKEDKVRKMQKVCATLISLGAHEDAEKLVEEAMGVLPENAPVLEITRYAVTKFFELHPAQDTNAEDDPDDLRRSSPEEMEQNGIINTEKF